MTLETWRLLDLGPVDPIETQTIFDMIAQGITEGESENTLIINWPSKPLVSIGYFQEIEKDIDLEFCRENDIVVARRVIGGGGVYLDDGQMFYQIIHSLGSPTSVRSINGYYRKFLKAPVQAYRNLGIDAEFKPVNDIQAGGKKISGNGAGDVGDARILSGNLIFDFNFDMMVKILRVPDEKFRDKIAQGLRQRMGTIKQLTEDMPDKTEVKEDLLRLFEENLDIKLQKGQLNGWEKKRMSELRQKYLSNEWLHWRSGGRLNARTVRISSTTAIGTASYKAPGGLIRITVEDVEDLIIEIVISGDFTMLPSSAIESVERALLGANTTTDEVLQRVKSVYAELSIDSPGVTPEDFATTVRMALEQK